MAGYPIQRGRPPAITCEAAYRRLRDSGTLSGTSAEESLQEAFLTLHRRPLSEFKATTVVRVSGWSVPSTRCWAGRI
jgi:hypothetical protein